MRTVAIIQARMTSSRLPGKVLRPLAGKPVLWHIIHRLRKCKSLDDIAIATSSNSTDDAIQEFASGEGIEVVRGPEDNVLERYLLAAQRLGAEIIVRVTGDAPLLDSSMLDELVSTLVEKQVDYCVGDPQVPCIHEGFDPFTFRALAKLVREAGDDPVAKEHVTAYFKMHPGFVPTAYVPIDPDYQFRGARISVDTPADLRFLEEVYTRLRVPAGEAEVRDVVRLLRSEPELLRINGHVHQKGAGERSRKVLFRCDGDARVGLGHVVRCLALADEFRETHGWGVTFAMATGPVGFDLVGHAGHPIERMHGNSEDAWMGNLIQQLRPDALVLDVRSGLSRHSIEKWRHGGIIVVAIDDPSDRRLAADLAFYPPVPQVRKMDWTGFTGRLYAGWEWVVLRREFANRPLKVSHDRPLVLVTMGGSDPAGMTLKAVEALDLLDEDFDTVIVLGPGFCHDTALGALLAKSHRQFEVCRNVQDMAGLMRRADLAIASFGVTAYELAAMGVPAVYLCLAEDHAESALALAEARAGVSLGVYARVSTFDLARVVETLLHDLAQWQQVLQDAGQRPDGEGAKRIARTIASTIGERGAGCGYQRATC